MKRLFFLLAMLLSVYTVYAQSNVTRFLGIPVDGFKPDMVRALQAKGFASSEYDKDILEGEFNGAQVNVHIATQNNKVWRIMVCDKNTVGETDIKIRFNRLCRHFSDNKNYWQLSGESQEISEEEDISYEIAVNDKRYEAIFCQRNQTADSLFLEDTKAYLLTKYTEEEIANPTEEIQEDITNTYTIACLDPPMATISMRPVWFMISEYYGKYYITMFYDNEYNHANGDQL